MGDKNNRLGVDMDYNQNSGAHIAQARTQSAVYMLECHLSEKFLTAEAEYREVT